MKKEKLNTSVFSETLAEILKYSVMVDNAWYNEEDYKAAKLLVKKIERRYDDNYLYFQQYKQLKAMAIDVANAMYSLQSIAEKIA